VNGDVDRERVTMVDGRVFVFHELSDGDSLGVADWKMTICIHRSANFVYCGVA
jgi:hypothetical protein